MESQKSTYNTQRVEILRAVGRPQLYGYCGSSENVRSLGRSNAAKLHPFAIRWLQFVNLFDL